MDRDDLVRRAVWASVFFNAGGALAFLFPDSIGALMGLPLPLPRVHGATIALFVALFGGMYAWLAGQPVIPRPFVALAAIGKSSFFALMALFWLLGDVPLLTVVAASGDLAFAALFAWWLAVPVPASVRQAA